LIAFLLPPPWPHSNEDHRRRHPPRFYKRALL